MTAVQGFLDLLDMHVARYLLLTWQDAYKLLYQGVLGPEHLAAAPEAFAERLRSEFAAVPPAAPSAALRAGDEPLYEPVRPDGRLLRVNLRPFKAAGGDVEQLLDACLTAAAARWGAPEELRAAWAAVAGACVAGRWPRLGDVGTFSAWLDARDYPAVHHSPLYRDAYQPAYRLIGARERDSFCEAMARCSAARL